MEVQVGYYKRVGITTNRVITGKIYYASPVWYNNVLTIKITDERGGRMAPCINENNSHWELVEQETNDNIKTEKYMLNIKTVVMIEEGNKTQEADFYTDDEIIRLIQVEEDRIESLDEVKVESAAIKKLVAKHTLNIDNLVKILDKRND